jgi:hypothetical protein
VYVHMIAITMKALIYKTEPIHAPCCADMFHISGTIVLAITVDSEGDVTCVQMDSGHAPFAERGVYYSSLSKPAGCMCKARCAGI